jgi:hypothetical protein
MIDPDAIAGRLRAIADHVKQRGGRPAAEDNAVAARLVSLRQLGLARNRP